MWRVRIWFWNTMEHYIPPFFCFYIFTPIQHTNRRLSCSNCVKLKMTIYKLDQLQNPNISIKTLKGKYIIQICVVQSIVNFSALYIFTNSFKILKHGNVHNLCTQVSVCRSASELNKIQWELNFWKSNTTCNHFHILNLVDWS